MKNQGLLAAIVTHRLKVHLDKRLHQFDRLRPLHGEHRPKPAHVGPDDFLAGLLGARFRQMAGNPIDDFLAIAGVDHQHEKGLAVGIVVVADQHVVEDAAGVVGHQRVADLPQFEVGHPPREQFGQENRRAGSLEPQPAHVRDVGHAHRRADGQVFFDNRRVLHGHRPAGEIDHPPAVGNMPVVEGGMPQLCVHCLASRISMPPLSRPIR